MRFSDDTTVNYGRTYRCVIERGPFRHGVRCRVKSSRRVPLAKRARARLMLKKVFADSLWLRRARLALFQNRMKK